MGLPKAEWLTSSSLPAFHSAGQSPPPHRFLCSPGDWGSSNPSLAISRGPCRALGLACSPEPPLHRHALVPIDFRHKVRRVDRRPSLGHGRTTPTALIHPANL